MSQGVTGARIGRVIFNTIGESFRALKGGKLHVSHEAGDDHIQISRKQDDGTITKLGDYYQDKYCKVDSQVCRVIDSGRANNYTKLLAMMEHCNKNGEIRLCALPRSK